MVKNVIIIGAGPAGLTAAYELLKYEGYRPIILEQNNFIGGISATMKYKNNRIDMGGHRFFSKSLEVMDWWENILPIQGAPSSDDILFNRTPNISQKENAPNPETEDKVMLIRPRTSRIYYLNSFFDYPISLNFRTIKNLGLIRMFKIGFSYFKSLLFKRPEKSLEDFFINRFGQELYETFFKDYTEKLWGIKCADIAPDWGAQRIKGLSILKVITNILKIGKKETSLIEEFWYPKFGPGQLWEEVANKVSQKGGVIKLNTKVTKVNMEDGKVISVEINGNETLEADYVLSSMPIQELITALPDVPADVKNVASGLKYRDFRTAGLLLKKMKLGYSLNESILNGMPKDTWIYIQEKGVNLGRIQLFNNWSPYLVEDYQNTVWIGLEYFCSEQDELWNMSDENFIQLAITEAQKIGLIEKEDVIDSVSYKVPKAYPAYFGTYNQFGTIQKYLDTLPNLFVMGRNGMHRYNNMDHSVLSAKAVVQALINPQQNRTEIWNVNAEKEYHEKK
ncbi:MAG: NAD(P)/FAD-dependent oxidoreductase [Alphaproteobacteria bacterium]|nr:NAD(P)/FAD-dependent oxidoreductase [Alphaproteobacteria bacterium]